MKNPLLSRKFILAMSTLFVTAFLCYSNNIDGSLYGTVIIATVGAYITGNVIQKKD